jgi:AraC-like DNA-binding protein
MRSDIVPTTMFPELSDAAAGRQMRGAGMVSPCAKVRTAEVPTRPESRGLAKWRLKLVAMYVEEHLSEKVTLADMAGASRLSRMHFAVLFRRATGMRPHEYLLNQRIRAAQQMLQASGKSIVMIATDVGFQSQAHFTTVFKCFTNCTPSAWRVLVESELLQSSKNYDDDDLSLCTAAFGSGGTRLVTDLRQFDKEALPETKTTIALSAKIMDDGDQRGTRIFEKSIPMEGLTGTKAAAALNRALRELARDLIVWTGRARQEARR